MRRSSISTIVRAGAAVSGLCVFLLLLAIAIDAQGNALALPRSIAWLFLLPVDLAILRALWYAALAVAQHRRAMRRRFDTALQPPVSVILTACNRENTIACAVENVLRNGYPEVEVVVVDEGSTDETLDVLRAGYESDPHVRIATGARGRDALQRGIALAAHQVVVAVAPDTILQRGAVERMVRHFGDSAVSAVSGNVQAGSSGKWFSLFQRVEYCCGLSLDRRALEMLGLHVPFPGAAVAWRSGRQYARARYEPDAVAYVGSQRPAAAARQGLRWGWAAFRAAWTQPRGWRALAAPVSTAAGNVMLPALSPLIEPAMIAALFAGNPRAVLAWYVVFAAVEWAAGALACALERGNSWNLALLAPQRIFRRQMMGWALARWVAQALTAAAPAGRPRCAKQRSVSSDGSLRW